MSEYTCPFCKTEIEDSIESINEHRKSGGECDTRMDEQKATEQTCPQQNCGYGECSWLQGGLNGACDVHGNGEGRCQQSIQSEKLYLVCDNCGEAFDSIITAQEHGHSDLSGSAGWCGDNGFSIMPESEAL